MPDKRRTSSDRTGKKQTGDRPPEAYEKHKERAKKRSAEKTLAGQDIAPLPAIVDMARRERCLKSFRLFCETYFPLLFFLDWSEDQLSAINKIEGCVLRNSRYAFAMPRGSGKTTLCLVAVIWAILTGKHKYVMLICADEEESAKALMENLKELLSSNKMLLEDFPEIMYPIHRLEGETRRCNGQRLYGKRTKIKWNEKYLSMPVVPGSVASGARIEVKGILGNVRGRMRVLEDGTSTRPTLAIVDDPQTDQSAKSVVECEARLKVINKAICNLAGPKQKTGVVVPCTVIEEGDAADQLLNRELNPIWRGERYKLMNSLPTNRKRWEVYAEIFTQCLRENEGEDITRATDYYIAHRAEMDEGAEPTWHARFNDDEASAVQYAMNLKIIDEDVFYAEYQNDPKGNVTEEGTLTDLILMSRTNGRPRNEVPRETTILTAFIDVQATVLYYLVLATNEEFTGAVIDYGTFPQQHRHYYSLSNIRHTLQEKYPGHGTEAAIQAGLVEFGGTLTGREYRVAGDGGAVRVDQLLIDSGKWSGIVGNACRIIGSVAMPSKGVGIRAGNKPMTSYRRKAGERHGFNWYIPNVNRTNESRHVLIDVNYWKEFDHSRFLTPPGDPSSFTLFGETSVEHRMLADHVVNSESWTDTEGHGRRVREFKIKPNKPDNHLFDCLVGATVGASMRGAKTPDQNVAASKRKRRKYTAKDIKSASME